VSLNAACSLLYFVILLLKLFQQVTFGPAIC